jgi:hypothetical protein
MEDPTATSPRNNAAETPPRGRPFAAGNPGRPKGSRNRITRLVENLIEADAEEITRAALRRALDGDGAILRALLDRLAPPRRDRTIEIDLPKLAGTSDATAITAALVDAVADGSVTPGEAKAVSEVVDVHLRAVELREMEERLRRLEEAAERD